MVCLGLEYYALLGYVQWERQQYPIFPKDAQYNIVQVVVYAVGIHEHEVELGQRRHLSGGLLDVSVLAYHIVDSVLQNLS